MELYRKDSGRTFQVSSFHETEIDAITIAPGETAVVLDMQGPAVIQNMWVTFSSRDKLFLRRTTFQMYWDDESSPSVETPAGDFFCNGYGQRKHFVSEHIGSSSGGFYSYFPMPFRKSARIEVTNNSKQPLIFYFHFLGQKYNKLPDDTLYFHCQWRRENPTTLGKCYKILEAKGNGYFAGMFLAMQAYTKNDRINFLEGDEYFYIDGEKDASIKGTGTEDYFQGGWYFADNEFAAPYHGLVVKDRENSKISCYRWHTRDPINFETELKVEIEHGQRMLNEAKADYQSTAYWYQTEPHLPFEPMNKDREPIILKEQFIIPGAIDFSTHSSIQFIYNPPYLMSTYNKIGWSENIAGHFDMDKFTEGVEMDFTVPRTCKYDVIANYIANDHNAVLQCFVDGIPVGEPIDTYSDDKKDSNLCCTNEAIGQIKLATIELYEGAHKVSVKAVSKNNKAKSNEAIIDCIAFQPVEGN